ncbi:hypothetical protein [Thiomonas sp. X19]|uniref:hypothetical protein n=1 Tax=Thiomonas sp. X19 TaxID=1050370 RepID=UPI000DD63C17|nr:hypothetical protein [Thiomonas sp. X19]
MSKPAALKERRAKRRAIQPGLFSKPTASRSRAIADAFRVGRLDEARRLAKEQAELDDWLLHQSSRRAA